MSDDRYDPKPVEIPEEDESFYERPLFAYGIFKKGQLAYSKIADFVEVVVPDDVPFKMHIRDGVPVIKKEHSSFKTMGHRIYFADGKEEEAYSIISNTQLGNYYKWDTVDIGGETFNVLTTDDLDGTFVDVDENKKYNGDYDGRNDPFFFKVPKFIRDELKNMDPNDEYSSFRLQMYYMLLWTAVDRYCTLKYDVSKSQNYFLNALSQDEVFVSAFYGIGPQKRNPIHSARNASRLFFNRARTKFVLNFYYTVRCNVVHRGKESENNIETLITSLNDMLEVFDRMIEYTFHVDE